MDLEAEEFSSENISQSQKSVPGQDPDWSPSQQSGQDISSSSPIEGSQVEGDFCYYSPPPPAPPLNMLAKT